MIERLEVTPGPGTVIRFGHVMAWVSPAASPSLVSFLVESARNLASSPAGGDQLAQHLAGVLGQRDPEPHVPFVTVGPGSQGWAALLHGPVQVWDGAAWTTAEPRPGWLHTVLLPRPGLSVSMAGTRIPNMSPDSLLDLEAGVVPGGGFVMLPAAAAPQDGALEAAPPRDAGTATDDTASSSDNTASPTEDSGAPPEDTASPVAGHASGAADEGGTAAPQTEGRGQTDPVPDVSGAPEDRAGPGAAGAPGTTPGPATGEPDHRAAEQAPPGVLNLRDPAVRSRVVTYPPLPPGGDAPGPTPGAPVVAGVPCRRGHVNRPGMTRCARCGEPLAVDGSYQVSGTRPALGCLITDEGLVLRLDFAYLIGSDPARDPTVRGRLARPLVLEGEDVAATHAEIRLHDWDVVVTDRSTETGTHVYPPGATAWDLLPPHLPRVLVPGTHVAVGQRVLTFVSPWAVTIPGGGDGR